MIRRPKFLRSLQQTDVLLWTGIAVYIAVIYATLSFVPIVRKALVERFGYGVFDWCIAIFALAGLAFVLYGVRKFHGQALLRYFAGAIIVGSVYAWYLVKLPYAIERIHLLEYGLLGILIFIGCRRKLHAAVAVPSAVILTFVAGLGDEAIQHVVPGRVGEIRDAVTNGVSGLLGMVAFRFSLGAGTRGPSFRAGHLRVLIVIGCAATIGTALFLRFIQGFGYGIQSVDGTINTAIVPARLEKINEDGAFLSLQEKRTYENEAARHLFQRDFYFVNNFLAKDGSYYREHWRALGENRILETWYGRFLREHHDQPSAAFSALFDKKVGAQLGGVPVLWPDSLERQVAAQSGGVQPSFESRVNSALITVFTPRHLFVAEILVLVLFGMAWVAAGRTGTR